MTPARPPIADPYVATWARIIRAIVARERAEEADRRRSMSLVKGGKQEGTVA